MASRFINKEKLQTVAAIARTTAVVFCGVCIYRADDRFYTKVVMPISRIVEPETAHSLAISTLKWGLIGGQGKTDSSKLHTSVWSMKFTNPIGMAAGFDKQGEAVKGLHKLGFSFVEIGSVTPKPQPGNKAPRLFRLVEDYAVINRYGFNSDGHDAVWKRLRAVKNGKNFAGIIGVNLGANKDSRNPIEDYIRGIKKFKDVADYFVINVSSPNTPGLRSLQHRNNLEELLTKLNEARHQLNSPQPLLLKLAPDLSNEERQDIAEVILNDKSKVDGLVLCNTTIERSNLASPLKDESGGLSGAPITDMSTAMIADMYKRTSGSVPIIGVGGVFTGKDVFDKMKAGASLVQLYTSYVYHGPPIIDRVKKELEDILEENQISSVADIVGTSVK